MQEPPNSLLIDSTLRSRHNTLSPSSRDLSEDCPAQSRYPGTSGALAMKRTWTTVLPLLAVVAAVALVFFANVDNDKSIQLLNVSYDPTRELFQDLNRQFVSKYEQETGH